MGILQQTQPGETPHICNADAVRKTRAFLAKVGDKWSMVAIVVLAQMPGRRARFSELRRSLNGISQRMLTATLRGLERDGLLTREVFPEIPPRVEYELSPLGASLLEPAQNLVDWFAAHLSIIDEAQHRYDQQP